MIIGVGTDIIEIQRVEKAVMKPSFIHKYFTEQEWEQLAGKNPQSAAASFAGKEAVVKALGCGFRGVTPRDIEILRDAWGKPVVTLYAGAADTAARLGVNRIQICLSHCQHYAIAFAVAEGEG